MTIHTVIYGVHIRFWPTLPIWCLFLFTLEPLPIKPCLRHEEEKRGRKAHCSICLNFEQVVTYDAYFSDTARCRKEGKLQCSHFAHFAGQREIQASGISLPASSENVHVEVHA